MLLAAYTVLFLSLKLYSTANPIPQAQSIAYTHVGLEARSYSNPAAMPQQFADPCIIQDSNGLWWSFASNNAEQNVPVAVSADFTTWQHQDGCDALPDAGSWTAFPPIVWAPDVIEMSPGSFVMYYAAAWSFNTSIHCIGAATSTKIDGPYTPQPEPFVCPFGQGGAIDPSPILDPSTNQLYLLYKLDANTLVPGGPCGNSPSPPLQPVSTPILLQQISASDGLTHIGNPIQILDRGPYDGPLVEAPSMAAIKDEDGEEGWKYVLFFSSNCFNTQSYDVSYAVSMTGIEGQYEKAGRPLMVSDLDGEMNAPGGLDIAPDGQHVVFHADAMPGDASLRQLRYGIVSIEGTTVTI